MSELRLVQRRYFTLTLWRFLTCIRSCQVRLIESPFLQTLRDRKWWMVQKGIVLSLQNAPPLFSTAEWISAPRRLTLLEPSINLEITEWLVSSKHCLKFCVCRVNVHKEKNPQLSILRPGPKMTDNKSCMTLLSCWQYSVTFRFSVFISVGIWYKHRYFSGTKIKFVWYFSNTFQKKGIIKYPKAKGVSSQQVYTILCWWKFGHLSSFNFSAKKPFVRFKGICDNDVPFQLSGRPTTVNDELPLRSVVGRQKLWMWQNFFCVRGISHNFCEHRCLCPNNTQLDHPNSTTAQVYLGNNKGKCTTLERWSKYTCI